MSIGRALAPGTRIADAWIVERQLGEGGFGVTYEALHEESRERVALKEYFPIGCGSRDAASSRIKPALGREGEIFRWGRERFLQEAETLARLDHPSIVRVAQVFEANDTAYMALAYETGGTLGSWLKAIGRPAHQGELDRLIWALTEALAQVHSLFLLHRDVKPDNIMLRPDGTPVLIDFGAAKATIASHSRVVGAAHAQSLAVVSDGFSPPEQYSPASNLQGPFTDVYSLAATLYVAIARRAPPPGATRAIHDEYVPLTRSITSGDWRPGFLAAIDQALAVRREERPRSMIEFRRAAGVTEAIARAAQPIVVDAAADNREPSDGTDVDGDSPDTEAGHDGADDNWRHPKPHRLLKSALIIGGVALVAAGGYYGAVVRSQWADSAKARLAEKDKAAPAQQQSGAGGAAGNAQAADAADKAKGEKARDLAAEDSKVSVDPSAKRDTWTLQGIGRPLSGKSPRNATLSPDGQRIAIGDWANRQIRVWDIRSGKLVQTMDGHQDTIDSVAIGRDGDALMSVEGLATVFLWSIKTGKLVRKIEVSGQGIQDVRALMPSPGMPSSFVGAGDDGAYIWNAKGEQLRKLPHGSPVNFVEPSADGRTIAASSGSSLILWQLTDGGGVTSRSVKAHEMAITRLAISPNGNFAITQGGFDTGKDATKLWDLATMKVLRTRADADAPFTWLDVGLIAFGSSIIDVRTWTAVRDLSKEGLADFVAIMPPAASSPDGSRIPLVLTLDSGEDQTYRLRALPQGR